MKLRVLEEWPLEGDPPSRRFAPSQTPDLGDGMSRRPAPERRPPEIDVALQAIVTSEQFENSVWGFDAEARWFIETSRQIIADWDAQFDAALIGEASFPAKLRPYQDPEWYINRIGQYYSLAENYRLSERERRHALHQGSKLQGEAAMKFRGDEPFKIGEKVTAGGREAALKKHGIVDHEDRARAVRAVQEATGCSQAEAIRSLLELFECTFETMKKSCQRARKKMT